MKVFITGGAGFIGSHVAEYYAEKNEEVVLFDNISRSNLLNYKNSNATYNLDFLKKYDNIEFIKGDIRNFTELKKAASDAETIIHTAAQTAVTTSLTDPRTDFEINALGSFNILEAARQNNQNPCLIFSSTNKVYGENVNHIPIKETISRYEFSDSRYKNGIPENYSIDNCEHTPYGCSKLCADIYFQDYAIRNEIDASVFRMSCIYGTRQFGVEDQGWIAWFCISTLNNKSINIFGDGKQVRDILFCTDLVEAYDSFVRNRDRVHHGIFNLGGGPRNTISLIELIDILEKITGRRSDVVYHDWRASDQKVYISDISKAGKILGWTPRVDPETGIRKLVDWVKDNIQLFNHMG